MPSPRRRWPCQACIARDRSSVPTTDVQRRSAFSSALSSWHSASSLPLAEWPVRPACTTLARSLTMRAGLPLGLTPHTRRPPHLGTYCWCIRRASSIRLLSGLVAALRPPQSRGKLRARRFGLVQGFCPGAACGSKSLVTNP